MAVYAPTKLRESTSRPSRPGSAFYARHGAPAFYAIHLLGLGLVPAYWLAPIGDYALSNREAMARYWRMFRAFWSAGGVVNALTAALTFWWLVEDGGAACLWPRTPIPHHPAPHPAAHIRRPLRRVLPTAAPLSLRAQSLCAALW